MRRVSTSLILLSSLCLGITLLLSSCYEMREGLRYLSILSKAKSIDSVLSNPDTSVELRLLLERARDARLFAVADLGLKETKNYNSVVILDADRLATVVQACAELSFTRYLWSYPVVGKMPYKGFFDPEDAKKEAARLKKQGYDVIARPVDAFSTLGYFADPLFSFMSTYSEAEIAELVIHEMTHSTIFLKGNRSGAEQFNEELATFVGRTGAKIYMAKVNGSDSKAVNRGQADSADARAFSTFLADTAKELEAVYATNVSDDEKRKQKAEIIASRAVLFKKESEALFKGELYKDFSMDKINNAYLDLYRLYEGESALYKDFYVKRCDGDLKIFIQTIARIVDGTKGDPRIAMRQELEAGPRQATSSWNGGTAQ
ncbi:aminopeptidase [Treponema sp.]